MSSESRVEPRQHREEPGAGQRQDTQHVRGYTQQTMSGLGQSDEEEKGSPPNLPAVVEAVVLQNVNGAEVLKEKCEIRRRAAQRHRAKHLDAAPPGV